MAAILRIHALQRLLYKRGLNIKVLNENSCHQYHSASTHKRGNEYFIKLQTDQYSFKRLQSTTSGLGLSSGLNTGVDKPEHVVNEFVTAVNGFQGRASVTETSSELTSGQQSYDNYAGFSSAESTTNSALNNTYAPFNGENLSESSFTNGTHSGVNGVELNGTYEGINATLNGVELNGSSFNGTQEGVNSTLNGVELNGSSFNGTHEGVNSTLNGVELNGSSYNGTHEGISATLNGVSNEDLIPSPPPLPSSFSSSPIEELISSNVTTETLDTLTSVGLGGWFPPGIVQQSLNFLHESGALPWWLAIFVGTLTVRIAMFPIVVYGQRNAAHVSNNMPKMQVLQAKMAEARRSGDNLESARYANEMMHFMKENNVNPLRNLVLPLVQAPIFISFFIGLRKMANLPLESMKDGGVYWFTNLTVADPYFILPVLTSATLLATIELGADGIRADNMKMARYFLRAMPIIIFPFIINFPAAILCYWLSSNALSLGQVALLKIPAVREYFKIPKINKLSTEMMKKNRKGFIEGFKDSYTNTKITRELEERARIDEVAFKKSGVGPVPKTYRYDPTKQKPISSNSVLTKKR